MPFPPPGGLSNPGIEVVSLGSPELAGGFLTTSTPWGFEEIDLISQVLPRWLSGLKKNKKLPANAGETEDASPIPGSGRPPGGRNGNPFQYCLENPLDRGA